MESIRSIAINQQQEKLFRSCQYCGKPFKEVVLPIIKFDTSYKQYVPDCDCIEKIEAEKKAKEEQELKAKILQKRFDSTLLTPFFLQKRFENMTIKAEHFDFCQKYADDFQPSGENGIIMIGNTGTGKSTLQACICNALTLRGFSCLFITFAALMDRLTNAKNFESKENVDDILKWLCEPDYVVLDDLGRENYTESKLSLAFRVIDSLMNNCVTTGVTMNAEKLAQLSAITDFKAILDRFYTLCPHQLEFHGESLRRKKLLQ